tara:strand:+ start:347 stop:1267 length:921 start_codon:yes stop_codon:yes gene_type:complete
VDSASSDKNAKDKKKSEFTRNDLLLLTKARLSILVIVTAIFGFIVATKSRGNVTEWWLLFHTIIGCAFAAAASSIFNQLMEIEIDAKMSRTSDRPLPKKKIKPAVAFVLGWTFAAIGLVHLAVKVNPLSCAFAASTLFVYMFIYTPMKRRSGMNTLVGAISGALPPLIGWAGAGGEFNSLAPYFIFGLLFLWQLPHFVAINWMYREEYESAGFVMWSNGDIDGARTANLAILFTVTIIVLMGMTSFTDFMSIWATFGLVLISIVKLRYAISFKINPSRDKARSLFLYTLLYLPVSLAIIILGWKVQ